MTTFVPVALRSTSTLAISDSMRRRPSPRSSRSGSSAARVRHADPHPIAGERHLDPDERAGPRLGVLDRVRAGLPCGKQYVARVDVGHGGAGKPPLELGA